ncbi:MAG: ABC transporter substrate-binding protein [Chloroflexota bacterium]
MQTHTTKSSFASVCLFIICIGTLFTLISCTSASSAQVTSADAAQEGADVTYAGKKILWVDSYHDGYEWSGEIESGLRTVLDQTDITWEIVRMDTKRNDGDEFGEQAALAAKAKIESFQPDVLIACDDNAQKYLVEPYLKDTDLPVVFCGVNWDASVYGYPASNVTGIVEVELVAELFEHLKQYAKGDRVVYLGPDVTTERKVTQIYNELFFDGEMGIHLVKTFDEFKAAFIDLQKEYDIVYIGNKVGLDGWDDAEGEQFIIEHSVVPTGSRSAWLIPYALITLAKRGDEHGEWAAQTALDIIDGMPISDIPITQNQTGELFLNLNIAETLDIVFTPTELRNADIYDAIYEPNQ